MSLIPYRDLKFLRLLTRLDSRYAPKEVAALKQLLNSEIIKFPLINPFIVHPFPPVTETQIPIIILYLAKQMEEIGIKNLNLFALENFIASNLETLVMVLTKEPFHCQMFCQAFIRYLQDYAKNKELIRHLSKMKMTAFVNLFTAVLQGRKTQKTVKAITAKDKDNNHLIHTVFNALFFSASAKYLRESEQEQLCQEHYLDIATKAACLMIEECENQYEFQAVREYLSVISHLLIFNGMDARPIKLLDFCLDSSQALCFDVKNTQPQPKGVQKYIRSLYSYSLLDPEYRLSLLKLTRNLLLLNISNPILISHFEVLLELIRSNIFYGFKKLVFDVLIESQSKRTITVVDEIFLRLLSSGIDLLDDQIQNFNLILAQRGETKRKEQFALVYYYHYQQAYNKVQPQVINFILEVYFEQDIPLEKLDVMVARQANIVSAANMKKLHSLIGQKKKISTFIPLLTMIIEKRRTSSRKSSHPFVTQDWLIAAGNNTDVYKIYLKVLTETLCGRTLDIYGELVNINASIVKIQGEFWSRSLEFYSIILKTAEKYEVYEEQVFRYLILLQALFGEKMATQSYSYFSKYFHRVANPQCLFLTFLEYLVTLLKNKSSVLIYLQAVLEFQSHLNQVFYEKKMYDIFFLATLLQRSEYVRISTYSLESVTVIYQLSLLVKDPAFQDDFLKIMQYWSSVMNRSQCKSLEYFFVFRQIKKIYPFMKEREMKQPTDRIKIIWDLILKLLDEKENKNNYIQMAGNKVAVEWKGQEMAKRGIRINGNFIRNTNFQLFWHIKVDVKEKTYIFSISNDRVLIEIKDNSQQSKDKKQLKEFVKQFNNNLLKKRPQSISFDITIENYSKKVNINIKILETEIANMTVDGHLMEGDINWRNNAILKSIRISQPSLPGVIEQITDHITPLNRWFIKVPFLISTVTQSFSQKFDFEHAYHCIGEMLQHFNHINLPFAYEIFIGLSVKLIMLNMSQDLKKIEVIMQTFNTIEENYTKLKGKGKLLAPIIDIDSLKNHPKSSYFLFASALLPKIFWINFNEQTKGRLSGILKELVQIEQFRRIQNKKIFLFDQCLQICKDYRPFFQVCEKILDTHEFNQIFRIKFKKILCLSKEKQQSIYLVFLKNYVQKILLHLNIQNQQSLDKKLRCKFLITESENEQEIFKMCSTQSKISILHYYSQNPSFNDKGQPEGLEFIKQLIELVKDSEKDQVLPWLIIQVKQLLFKQKFIKDYDIKSNFKTCFMYFQLLLINRRVGSECQQKDMNNFILDLLQTLKHDIQVYQKKIELEKYFISAPFFTFFKEITKEIIESYGNINAHGYQSVTIKQYEISIKIITNFQKTTFLQFLIRYRSSCSHDYKCLKALIQHESFKNLKLTHFSIFLQYLFQILLLIEQKSNLSLEQCQELILNINQYIGYLHNNLDKKVNLSKSLFYNYPRMAGTRQGLQDTSKVLRKMKKAESEPKILELRGGVYFKCVAIVLKLMKLNPNIDYNNLVDYFLFGPQTISNTEIKPPKLLNKPSIELTFQTTFTTKERSSVQTYISDVAEDHKLYFIKEDQAINSSTEEVDLSIFIVDYFLMSIAEFLQENGEKIDGQLLEKYSSSFAKGISSQKITKQLLVASIDNYQIIKYDDVTRFLLFQKLKKEIKPPNSPVKSNQRPQSFRYDDGISNWDKQAQLFSPKRRMTARKKTQDLSLEPKKRTQIIDSIKIDYKNWYRKSQCKKISLFFCDKAKQIRILELIHSHYVLANPLATSSSAASKNNQRQQRESYLKNYANYLKIEKKELYGSGCLLFSQKVRKVKKIYPYTSSKSPVFHITENCLVNMTSPITIKITQNAYDIRRQTHNESIYMNYYLNARLQEDSILEDPQKLSQLYMQVDAIEESMIAEDIKMEENFIEVERNKEKPYCELVTREGNYFCQYYFEPQRLILFSKKDREITDNLWYLKLGSPKQSLIMACMQFEINFSQVVEIFSRKFTQITNNSMQLFMKNGTSRFITFYRKQTLAAILKQIQRLHKNIKIIKDPIKQFEDLKYTQKWIQGNLSNFDYLMLLNKFSGRTYNDLNQYYVFPWILKDYHSQMIDLTDPNVYRDLSKPIGAVNPEKLKRYLSKYKSQSLNADKCIYGSHYSTSLFVFYYLIRLEPYSSLHRDMQNGGWDSPDRLFNSIEQVWDSLCNESATSDVKECIPEFYYMPAFLRNIAHIELGKKQCGSYVGDVQLPPWAKSAEEFVVTMRAALQSDFVSQNLHLWIDLIFGKHQHSQERFNVFHPYCYSDPEILLKLNSKNYTKHDGVLCQINYFGQCPIQLFKRQHKPKKIYNEMRQARSTYIININRPQSFPSQTVVGEVDLLPDWKITRVLADYHQFIIQLKNVTKQETQAAIISAFANLQELKQSIKELEDMKKIEAQTITEPKITVNDKNQIYIGKDFLMDLDVNFPFSYTRHNELWISCFGCKGIRIYNWQLELNWNWEKEEVRDVHLEATRLIFSTPNGKLYCFSFLDRRVQQTVVFKEVCDMMIRVICLPRLPNRQKNQIHYKILCIGDLQKVAIVSFTFEECSNYTSQGRSSIY